MERIEFVFKALAHLASSLLIEGLFFIVLGILVYIYPSLIVVLASIFFILVGLTLFYIGTKVKKYSKIKINL